MSVDHTKVVYYSGFNSYRNLGVFESAIAVTGVSIAADTVQSWSTTIDTGVTGTFVTASVQSADGTGLPTVTSDLYWRSYPAASTITLDLATDPGGFGAINGTLDMKINGTEVTFIIYVYNFGVSPLALTPVSVGVRYAIHATDE